ncbi:MAG: YqgE/AlgH family protein [Bacteroidetes bacterium]|nr:YqgE/AlgH family protein [Bacteroidota bacterium]
MTDINKILEIKPNKVKPSQGKLLIAEPFTSDYYFKRSVILLAEHNEEGSYGMVFNKPLYINLNELIKDFPSIDAPLFLGGPVKTDSLFYIHKFPEIINSIKINEELYWGGDIDIVKDMISSQQLNKDNIRFFVGYAGWSPKQLDEELRENYWVVSRVKTELLLNEPPSNIWNKVVVDLGDDYAHWVNFPVNPSMN